MRSLHDCGFPAGKRLEYGVRLEQEVRIKENMVVRIKNLYIDFFSELMMKFSNNFFEVEIYLCLKAKQIKQ